MKKFITTILVIQLGSYTYAQDNDSITYQEKQEEVSSVENFFGRFKKSRKKRREEKRKKLHVELAPAFQEDEQSEPLANTNTTSSSYTYHTDSSTSKSTSISTHKEVNIVQESIIIDNTSSTTQTPVNTNRIVYNKPILEKPVVVKKAKSLEKVVNKPVTTTKTYNEIVSKAKEVIKEEPKQVIKKEKKAIVPAKKQLVKSSSNSKKSIEDFIDALEDNEPVVKESDVISEDELPNTKVIVSNTTVDNTKPEVVLVEDDRRKPKKKKKEKKKEEPQYQERLTTYDVEEDIIDYGEIEQGSNGVREFKLTNTGIYPLIVSKVYSTCGCTIPEKPNKPILPGKSGSIKIKYDTKRIGPFHKTVTVYSNAVETIKSLKIKGVVLAPSEEI